jgi:hypothetical protein
MPGTVIDDVRTLDPVSYIRQLGLHPEDSYGFLPMKLEDGTSLLYLYRDRPEYEERRPKLAPPVEAQRFGPIEVEPSQTVEFEAPMSAASAGGDVGEIIKQAQELQQAWGGGQQGPLPAPGDPLPTPDVDKLQRLAKLRQTGAINDEEFARLRAEAGAPESFEGAPQAAGTVAAGGDGGAPIVAHRLYPGVRMRSSTRQLDHFLPTYCETVGVLPQDVYGVFPRETRWSSGGADNADSKEWDDYWIVYRDRPEYEAGRQAYAQGADRKGRWPDPVIAPGVGEAPASTDRGGKLKVEKDRWPRKALVVKQTGTELADSLREKISKWGYEPEDSYGFCPNFPHSSIYFGWRKA